MLSFVNSVVTTLFPSVILILFYQIIIIRGQFVDFNSVDEAGFGGYIPPLNNYNDMLEGITNELNGYFQGRTFQYADLMSMITDNRMYNDQCEFQLRSDVNNFMGDRIIIGQLSNVNQIVYVQISFHDDNDDFIRDYDGNPIVYTSTRQALGHVLDILHQGFAFSYAKCLLRLQPNSNFDPRSLFFHFARPSSTTPTNILKSGITGPTAFSIDSLRQTYSVSYDCPFGSTCMWLLDDAVISTSPNTLITLTFDQSQIGNRTLSYVAYNGNNPQVLASLSLSILPSTRGVCNTALRSTRNRWAQAGDMSSPRIYFTVTYLSDSGYLIIAGGTADNSTALLSVDIYDPTTGCYNVSNMTSPRMKHTATNYNNSDIVIFIGGVWQGENLIPRSELFSLNGSQSYQTMQQPRYFHETVGLSNSNILVVAVRRFTNLTKQLEIYNYVSAAFLLTGLSNQLLLNVEGHSVTALGDRASAFIFGGYNSTVYSRSGFITDGTYLTLAENDNETEWIIGRAHHQATYIPTINAILITGGNNGRDTFSSCYLYDLATGTFNTTGSMQLERSFHAAVLLSNGSVLIIGGAVIANGNEPIDILSSVERYDPSTGTFTFIASLNIARYRHKAIALPNNQVFVFGGIGVSRNILSSLEYITLSQ